MTPQETLSPFVIGETWSKDFQLGSNEQGIISSTNASPIVLTVNQAGFFYANGNSVLVAGHNNDAANGVWTVSGVTQGTLALTGSTGSGVGGQTGYVADVIDATSGTVYLFLLDSFNSDKPIFIFTSNGSPVTPLLERFAYTGASQLGTFTWNDRATCDFSCSLTIAQGATLSPYAGNNLYGLLYYIDSNGVSQVEERLIIPIQ